jgi:cytochrome c
MHYNKTLPLVVAGALGLGSGQALAEKSAEHQLADIHGCTACHALKPATATGEGKKALPIGPSFQDIAVRFHANQNPDKYAELMRIVKHGSSPYRSHFRGKISGLAMPPNDETISDLDINRLLVWILTSKF